MSTKNIKNKLLTDEQMVVMKSSILSMMKEQFIQSGVPEIVYDETLGQTAAQVVKEMVKVTQMSLLEKATYEEAANGPKVVKKKDRLSKKIKKTTKKIIKKAKK